MVLNTTNGPVTVPRGAREHVNTSAILEPPAMDYLDEPPEITKVLNAGGWAAAFEDGHQEELLFWCVLDDATVHGVVLDEDGLVNLAEGNVEARDGFRGYKQTKRFKGER